MKVKLNVKPKGSSAKKKSARILKKNSRPSSVIASRYILLATIFLLGLEILIPTLLNFPEGAINTDFNKQMTGIKYYKQFLFFIFATIGYIWLATKIAMRDVDYWYKNNFKKIPTKILKRIRKKCMILPYSIFASEIIIPLILLTIIFFNTQNYHYIMIFKVSILGVAAILLSGIVSFVFGKQVFDEILALTYVEGIDLGKRASIEKRIYFLCLGIIVASILTTIIVGYGAITEELDDLLFNNYKNEFNTNFNDYHVYEISEVKDILQQMNKICVNDKRFLLGVDGDVITVSGEEPSLFAKEYILQLSEKYDGKFAESFGVAHYGVSKKINTTDGQYYACLEYAISAKAALKNFIKTSIGITAVLMIILYIAVKSTGNRIKAIAKNFEEISNGKSKKEISEVADDEFGRLIKAFKKVQKLNKSQMEMIETNQNTMIERERLASLGQMVGGIAHNLKTPIFSIAGGLEGLGDLITEFDESIEDPNVTKEDMYEIVKDMEEWTKKLAGHTSYMSDVITAVKGQAVNLSEEEVIEFTIEELFKRVKVLMQHEVKHSQTELEISNKVDDLVSLHGGINNLVQVINNLISNAIQSYKPEEEKYIKLQARKDKSNIIITVQDFGPGIPKEVQAKMFKEMVTTKGKNGTGLGLYMSRSNIQAHFNGDLTYTTAEGIGTTFSIKIPIER